MCYDEEGSIVTIVIAVALRCSKFLASALWLAIIAETLDVGNTFPFSLFHLKAHLK